jgi:cytochrome c5
MLAWAPVNAFAAAGEAIYQSRCSTCHDSGAGQAPRISVRDEWQPRWQRGREAMHAAAIKGVPNTAMGAKGGAGELSDADVKAAVDYILARTGYQDSLTVRGAAPAAAVSTAPQSSGTTVDDDSILKRVAEALRSGVGSPDAQIESVGTERIVRGVNIKIAVNAGVVTLMGAMAKPDLIAKAEQIARGVNGVRRVENKLVAAGLFDWD